MPRVAVLDLLSRETEVVEASFCRDIDALGTSFAEHGDGFNGGERVARLVLYRVETLDDALKLRPLI